MTIKWNELLGCTPDNSFIAVARKVGYQLSEIFGEERDYADKRNIIIAAIGETSKIVHGSIVLHNPPLPPPPGTTGKGLANFHMIVNFSNSTVKKDVVFFCKLIDGCPHHDGSLKYTILLMHAVELSLYRMPSQQRPRIQRG